MYSGCGDFHDCVRFNNIKQCSTFIMSWTRLKSRGWVDDHLEQGIVVTSP